MGIENPNYRPVQTYVMNPKSITIGELYGEVNFMTMEWKDGVLGMAVRTAVQVSRIDRKPLNLSLFKIIIPKKGILIRLNLKIINGLSVTDRWMLFG